MRDRKDTQMYRGDSEMEKKGLREGLISA